MATMQDELRARPAGFVDEDLGLAAQLSRQLRGSLGESAAGPLGLAAEHAVSTSGKLVRPLLMLDACGAVGGDSDTVLPAAIGTEFGHIASLVHDDIIDGDTERRGRAAVHATYGLPLALLTGDLLVFQTFLCYSQCQERGISAERTLAAIRTLSCTCIELCRGQALEASCAMDLDLTEDRYLEIIRLKTASVCRAAAEIGARLGGGSERAVATLAAYGEALGIAFQILDDTLAYEGRAEKVGKPLESDMRNGRITLPLIYAAGAAPAAREAIANLLGERASSGRSAYLRLAELVKESGALARTRALAARYTATATRQLDRLPRSDARERLRARAEALLGRDQ